MIPGLPAPTCVGAIRAWKQRERLRQAAAILESAGQVDSEYRQEAILLQSEVLKGLGDQDLSIEQLLTLGDADATARQFAEAEQSYSRAIKLATERGDTKSAGEANRRWNRVRYLQARDLYTAGKYEEAVALAGPIARAGPAGPSASQAALLGLWSAQRMCADAQDSAAAAARVEKIADFIRQNWTGRPEADEARIALAQTRFLRGDFQLLGRHALAASVSYPIDVTLNASLMVLVDPLDGSGVVAPSLSWDLAESVSLLGSGYVGWGALPAGLELRSSLGLTPLTVLVQLRVYDQRSLERRPRPEVDR